LSPFLEKAQRVLEDRYRLSPGATVTDFIRLIPGLKARGTLWIEQSQDSPDLDVAVLLDRDLFEALPHAAPSVSVGLEEVSHFVYLSHNHNRGRNVTRLEMEIQSEVDRIVLAFDPRLGLTQEISETLLQELHFKPYSSADYETARSTASEFLRSLRRHDPRAWTDEEHRAIQRFYELPLQEKLKSRGTLS
jgi:hypothetical protein